MRYYLNRYQAEIELTSTQHGACVRVSYGSDKE